MNKVILIGRLTRDPELKYTQANQAVCSFTLAIDKQLSRDKRQEAENNGRPTADFPRIQVWGAMAENCNRYLAKGSQCAVAGRIQTGSYKDKDGKTIYTTDVVADNVEFLSKNDGGQADDNSDFFDNDFEEVKVEGRIPF